MRSRLLQTRPTKLQSSRHSERQGNVQCCVGPDQGKVAPPCTEWTARCGLLHYPVEFFSPLSIIIIVCACESYMCVYIRFVIISHVYTAQSILIDFVTELPHYILANNYITILQKLPRV